MTFLTLNPDGPEQQQQLDEQKGDSKQNWTRLARFHVWTWVIWNTQILK